MPFPLVVVLAAWRTIRAVIVATWYLLPLSGAGPVRLRRVLERLGPTWIKLGQALAMRRDVLPAAYCQELSTLLEQVEDTIDETAVAAIIARELGGSGATFAQMSPAPFRRGSIGQVHRATLPTGERVVVKVQRPAVRWQMWADVVAMYCVGNVLDVVSFGTRYREVVLAFARWTADELDYYREAQHATTLGELAHGDSLERCPRVHWQHTTSRVLTLEQIDGIPLTTVLAAVRERDDATLRDLEHRGHVPRRIAAHLMWNTMNQMYRHGWFHADLHPANLFVQADDTIAYVDFGIVGRLDEDVRESLGQVSWRLYRGEFDRAADEFMRWVRPSTRTDLALARDDLRRVMQNYLFRLRHPDSPGADGDQLVFDTRLLETVRRHNMVPSPRIVLYLKAAVAIETLIRQLDPEFDLEWHENRFFARLLKTDAAVWVDPSRWAGAALDYSYRARRLLDLSGALDEARQDLDILVQRTRQRLRFWGSAAAIALVGYLAVQVTDPPEGTIGPWAWARVLQMMGRGLVLFTVAVSVPVLIQSVHLWRVGRFWPKGWHEIKQLWKRLSTERLT